MLTIATTSSLCPKCGKPFYFVGDWFGGDLPCCTCPPVTYTWTGTSSPAAPRETSLREEMERIGNQGSHVEVHYDPLRKKKKWTVIVDVNWLGHTDNPVKLLRTII